MAKYAWLTDIHLDHLRSDQDFINLGESIKSSNVEGVFISGDISNGKQLVLHLGALEQIVRRPIFFVLGNHDFYGSSTEAVRKSMHELSNMSEFLKYMPLNTYLPLSPSSAIVGHDGWYDANYGDAMNSRYMLNDWVYIQDFVESSGGQQYVQMMGALKDKKGVIGVSQKLARAGVTHMMNGIKTATRYHKNIFIVSHVPPFKETHIYRGQIGDDGAQPWYTNKMFGDMLMEASRSYPSHNFTVLCGHTHGKCDVQITKNLEVHVGHSEYGAPAISGLIEVP